MYSIGQFAKKTGVTIRTLRYYDEKGLLSPAFVTENGQRFYDDSNIIPIQKIMMCKYLDYSLEEIKALLQEEKPILSSLYEQKEQLEQKQVQLARMIASVDTAIQIHETGEKIDSTSLLVVLHSMLTIDEQKAYLKAYLPAEIVEKMYHYFDESIVELNRQYIELTHALKEAYRNKLSDDTVKVLLERYLSLVPRELVVEIATSLQDVTLENLDSWLFTSLFTEEEEKWLLLQMEKFSLTEGFVR